MCALQAIFFDFDGVLLDTEPVHCACWAEVLEPAGVTLAWDYYRDHWKRNAGLRLDHLLLSSQLAPALAGAGVDTWVRDRPDASDHAPAWIEIDSPPRIA